MKLVHNSPQLREWLRREPGTAAAITRGEFYFEEEVFQKMCAELHGRHPGMSQPGIEMRAALHLIREGHACHHTRQARNWKLWAVIALILAALLVICIAARAQTQKLDPVSVAAIRRHKQLAAKFTSEQMKLQHKIQREMDEYAGIERRLAQACPAGFQLDYENEICAKAPAPNTNKAPDQANPPAKSQVSP